MPIPHSSLNRIRVISAGVILANDPAPIESRHFNEKDVKAAGIFASSSSSGQPAAGTSTTTTPVSVPTQPIAAAQAYVPNSLDGRLRIANVEFLEEYADHASPIYRTITRELESDIKESLDDDSLNVKVLNLT